MKTFVRYRSVVRWEQDNARFPLDRDEKNLIHGHIKREQ